MAPRLIWKERAGGRRKRHRKCPFAPCHYTFYVDADRQTRLLQARDKLHTMSDALRGQLNGLNRLIADTVARVRHQAPAVARQQEMRCVHVSAARPGGSRAAIQWAS